MAKRGGFPGGMPGNMNNLMKQAQRMQRQMEEQQAELENKEFSATAGGGVVEVTVTGKREVSKVKIDPEAVDPDDVEMLEDLIVAATNEALRKCEEESQAQMAKITGGLGGLGGGHVRERHKPLRIALLPAAYCKDFHRHTSDPPYTFVGAPKADRLADMRHADFDRPVQIRNCPRGADNPVVGTRAEAQAAEGIL